MTAIFKRELRGYFRGAMGYLFTAAILLFVGIYTMAYNLSGNTAAFQYVLGSMCFIYIMAVPLLTMRSVAEEKRQKTDQLLYSSPVRMSGVILGKYFAMLAVLLVPCAVMSAYPLLLAQFGPVDLRVSLGALFGFYMLGASLIALGTFISSLAENQVAAAVITLVAVLLLYFMTALASFVPSDAGASAVAVVLLCALASLAVYLFTKSAAVTAAVGVCSVGGVLLWYELDSAAFEGLFGRIMRSLSVFDRFDTFVEGLFDLRAVVYFISFICVLLFAAVQVMEKRRWSE